jgi:hypothetical protein
MKRKTVLVLLAGALMTSAAWGQFWNKDGTIAISNSGIVSKGSELDQCFGVIAGKGHSLGTVSFVAGALASGSLEAGGTFAATGSSFMIFGVCKKLKHRGVLFSGRFQGPITWTLVSENRQKMVFVLNGHMIGINHKGHKIGANMTQTIVTTKEQLAQGIGHIVVGLVVLDT